VQDGGAAPVDRIPLPAARTSSATPLFGEDDLRAVVVERCRVPVREVRVRGGVETLRSLRIADVQQDAVARAGAGGQTDLREHRDVVTLVGFRRALRALAVRAAAPQARD